MTDFDSSGNQYQSSNNSFKAIQASAAQAQPVPVPVTNHIAIPGLPPTTPGQVPAGQIAIKNVFMEPGTTMAAQVPPVPVPVTNHIAIPGLPPTLAPNFAFDPGDPHKHIREMMADIEAGRLPAFQTRWQKPEPLEPDPLPSFPVHAVPEPLRSWIVEVSQHSQTPMELAGLFGLAVCSAAISRGIVIDPGGWKEEVALYTNCALESGNRKSSVVEQAREPILELEAELLKAARPAIARAESTRRTLEESLKKAQQDAAKSSGEAQQQAIERAGQLAEQLSALESIPVPRLIMEDCTPEKVEEILANGSGRLFLCGAEGGVFDIMAGRNNGGMSNFEVYLKSHAGECLRVGRLSREAIVDRPILTMAYAVQPSVLTAMVARPEFRGRGMLARFLYAMPASPLGSRQVRDVPAVSDHVRSEYRGLIRRLYQIPHAATPHVLTLAPDAQEMMIVWCEEVERMLAHGGELELMRDWGGKLAGLTARLAAIMHCIECDTAEPWLVPVSAQTLAGAIEISRYAIPHASAVLGLMADSTMSEVLDDAKAIVRKLREQKPSMISEREIHGQNRRRFDRQKERLVKAIQLLIDRGWLGYSSQFEPNPVGRPQSTQFDVNPMVYIGF